MVFNTTFNTISVISWQSVLLVEESTALPQVTDKLYHIILYTSSWSRFELTTSVVIGTDGIGSCKSNYHTITVTTAPICQLYYFSSDVVYVISTEQVIFFVVSLLCYICIHLILCEKNVSRHLYMACFTLVTYLPEARVTCCRVD